MEKHPWMGLLQGCHIEFLYYDEKVSRDLKLLIEKEKSNRVSVLRELNIEEQVLHDTYEILSWCDRASLIFCQKEIPAKSRWIEILTMRDGTEFYLKEEGGDIIVKDWPFRSSSLEVEVEYRSISNIKFHSDLELKLELESTSPQKHKFKLTSESVSS